MFLSCLCSLANHLESLLLLLNISIFRKQCQWSPAHSECPELSALCGTEGEELPENC